MYSAFDEAKRNCEFRQEYLDSISDKLPGGINQLVYDFNGSKLLDYAGVLLDDEEITMETYTNLNNHIYLNNSSNTCSNTCSNTFSGADVPPYFKIIPYFEMIFSKSLIGQGKSHPLFVYKPAFVLKSEEFFSFIWNHEAVHAEHLVSGIKLGNGLCIDQSNISSLRPMILAIASEILAYVNELSEAEKKGGKNSYYHEILEHLQSYDARLRYIRLSNNLEQTIQEEMLKISEPFCSCKSNKFRHKK